MINRDVQTRGCAFGVEVAARKIEIAAALRNWRANSTRQRRRNLVTSARGSGVVGYKVQTAVDAKHHLVVTPEVTNRGTDRAQLYSMGKQAQQILGTQQLMALADRGYYAGPEILACEQAGINALVPKFRTSDNLAKGRFDKRDFHSIRTITDGGVAESDAA